MFAQQCLGPSVQTFEAAPFAFWEDEQSEVLNVGRSCRPWLRGAELTQRMELGWAGTRAVPDASDLYLLLPRQRKAWEIVPVVFPPKAGLKCFMTNPTQLCQLCPCGLCQANAWRGQEVLNLLGNAVWPLPRGSPLGQCVSGWDCPPLWPGG